MLGRNSARNGLASRRNTIFTVAIYSGHCAEWRGVVIVLLLLLLFIILIMVIIFQDIVRKEEEALRAATRSAMAQGRSRLKNRYSGMSSAFLEGRGEDSGEDLLLTLW